MLKLKHYSDAGHGWLAVKRNVLARMGLLEKVSAYSYQSKSGQTVYLEEDGDASTFIRRARELGIEPQIESVDAGDRAAIRSYPRFQLAQNETQAVTL